MHCNKAVVCHDIPLNKSSSVYDASSVKKRYLKALTAMYVIKIVCKNTRVGITRSLCDGTETDRLFSIAMFRNPKPFPST
jgi:hypothetical protein